MNLYIILHLRLFNRDFPLREGDKERESSHLPPSRDHPLKIPAKPHNFQRVIPTSLFSAGRTGEGKQPEKETLVNRRFALILSQSRDIDFE